MFYSVRWLITTITIIIVLILPFFIHNPPFGLESKSAFIVLCLMVAMALLWALETIPQPITALIPIIYLPLMGVLPVSKILPAYSNSVVFLFLGGFIIGLAMEKHNLHKRIALNIMMIFGTNAKSLLFGIMLSAAFVSMWINNTTTAIMMTPLTIAIISSIRKHATENKALANAFLIGVAYACSIGGIATIVGSTPNIFLKGFIESQYGITMDFITWMIIGVPVSFIMLLIAWFYLSFNLTPSSNANHNIIKDFKSSLPTMQKGEIITAIIFATTAFLWITQNYFNKLLHKFMPSSFGLNDTIIAMIASVAIFTLPISLKNKEFILGWHKTKELPWGILLLFGGGLALSIAINETGLSTWFSGFIKDTLSLFVLILLITTIIVFLTEVNSNTATSATFIPILAGIAQGSTLIPSPIYVLMPVAIAASCAFMMPISTPPNAIVYSTGKLSISEMLKKGFVMNILSIIIITLLCYFLIGFVVKAMHGLSQ